MSLPEIVDQLVEHRHVDVPARRALPEGRAPLSLVVEAIIQIVSTGGSYPRNVRPGEAYEGGILVHGQSGYEIHWQAEVGFGRFETLRVDRYSSLQEAARAFALREWPHGIDGIPFDTAA